MTISLICWSHRTWWSTKVADFLEARLKEKWVTTSRINLSEANIPLRSPDRWNSETDVHDILNPIRDTLANADWFVIISPERWWMVAPALKNFFLLWNSDRNEFAHKPGLLVWVSWGTWWSYPLAELRMASNKNTKICYIPDSLVVRKTWDVMNDINLTSWSEDDQHIKARADRSLDVLIEYTKAMSPLRKQTDIDLMKHEYGM